MKEFLGNLLYESLTVEDMEYLRTLAKKLAIDEEDCNAKMYFNIEDLWAYIVVDYDINIDDYRYRIVICGKDDDPRPDNLKETE